MDCNFLQKSISAWAISNFGEIAKSKEERALRFLEESLELCQVLNVDKETISRFTDIVYNKPVGELEIELADVQLNLYALAQHHQVSLAETAQKRFLGCLEQDRDYLRGRQARKYETGLSTPPV